MVVVAPELRFSWSLVLLVGPEVFLTRLPVSLATHFLFISIDGSFEDFESSEKNFGPRGRKLEPVAILPSLPTLVTIPVCL